MGTAGLPGFLPDYFSQFNKQNLIMALSLLAVSFYGVNIVAQKTSRSALKAATLKILSSIDKVPLFENQNGIAETAYQKSLEIASQLSFFTLALMAVFYIYPELAFVNLSVSMGITAFFISAQFKRADDIEKKRSKLNALNKLPGLGFLISFAFIVSDYLFFSPPNLLFALLSLIITRQSFAKLINSFRFIDQLYDQKHKISSIFLEHEPIAPPPNVNETPFWGLLKPENSAIWLPEVISLSSGSDKVQIGSYKWIQSGLKNIICMKVNLKDSRKAFLIKIFNKKLARKALHEATLLVDKPCELPSVPLLAATMVRGFHCHVFDITDTDQGSQTNPRYWQAQFKKKLATVKPPLTLERRYRKSLPLLPLRLNSELFDRLELVAEDHEKLKVKLLSSQLTKLKNLISQQRMSIVSEPKKEQLICSNDGDILSFHWADWSIEPYGTGLSLAESGETGEELNQPASSLGEKPSEDSLLLLISLVSQLEKHFAQQQYRSALNLIPSILECLDNEKIRSKHTYAH
ncbi:hypothetical protein [Marinobacter sp. F4218]|uniref:hypothetical protein n=1 Tax=Marinobacter sp. F4218 TaxID=2862868 RepID=UPI001C635C09|nr:hypothetical protein [Marinobacter sp. F4218]MBW7470468.1 hypothetical protein [Marinobacter sp. F4218]